MAFVYLCVCVLYLCIAVEFDLLFVAIAIAVADAPNDDSMMILINGANRLIDINLNWIENEWRSVIDSTGFKYVF